MRRRDDRSDTGAQPGLRLAPAPDPRVVAWTDGRTWDEFVEAAPDGTLAHRWAWGDVVRGTYGHRTEFLAAIDGLRIRGVLPLVLVRSRLFGRHVVSMPFLDYGGLCTAGDREADRALLRAAVELASDQRAVLQLRHRGPRDLDLPASQEKVTMLLELEPDADAMWRRLPSKRRGQIRKGQRHGLVATAHGPEGVADFYRVLSHNMRDLGSPLHPVGFFEALLEALAGRAEILVVRDGGTPVGAGLVIMDRDTVCVPWSSSLRSHFAHAPNQILYWEAMRRGIERGARRFDFGRSSVDSGTYVAKREWGAEPLQLYWHHAPADRPPPEEDVQRMGWATRVWRRLPVRLANAIGPRIRGAITN